MHQVILRSAEMIQAGDIAGAERALVAVADQAGDHALVAILDDMQPKDLLAVMREFDSSKESIVNMLVTPEQFARAIVLEKKYGERTGERLRAMMNAIIHRDAEMVAVRRWPIILKTATTRFSVSSPPAVSCRSSIRK